MAKFFTIPNWGDNRTYEVPEEDILDERPLAEAPTEIEPPRWAIGAICKLGGQKHPKREITHTEYGPTGRYASGYTPNPVHGPWHGPLSQVQSDDIYKRALLRRNRKKPNNDPAARKAAPPGNLRNEDYRFWKGYALENTRGAVCRWCEATCMDRLEMQEHTKNGYCKERLLALYKYAKMDKPQQRYCFACRQTTSNLEWGLPLCNTISCFARWKCSDKRSWHGFHQYYEWAMEVQRTDPKHGPFSSVPEDEPDGH